MIDRKRPTKRDIYPIFCAPRAGLGLISTTKIVPERTAWAGFNLRRIIVKLGSEQSLCKCRRTGICEIRSSHSS